MLAITSVRRVAIIDVAEHHDAAVTAVLVAALDATPEARARELPRSPRYELRAGGELVALIETGTDETGFPDHAEAAALIQRIELTGNFSGMPY